MGSGNDVALFETMFWLPPGGTGNSIAAASWAESADLHGDQVGIVLAALADADVARYAVGSLRRGGLKPGRPPNRAHSYHLKSAATHNGCRRTARLSAHIARGRI
jgi:hypothetical protein